MAEDRLILTINKLRAFVRHSADAARMYSYWQSSEAETITLSGKQPYILTEPSARGG